MSTDPSQIYYEAYLRYTQYYSSLFVMIFVVYQPNTIELEIEISAKANKKGSEPLQYVTFFVF